MRRIWVAAYVAIVCLVGCQPAEVDHSQQPAATGPAATEKKAEALEQNAAAAGNKAPPSPSEIINKPEAQAVDPAGAGAVGRCDHLPCAHHLLGGQGRGDCRHGSNRQCRHEPVGP